MSDDEDVVERLRLAAKPEEWTSVWGLTIVPSSLMREAADKIERLRAQMLRFGNHTSECIKWNDGIDCTCGWDGVA